MSEIESLLSDMDDDEIDEFGYVLYTEFFDEEDQDEYEDFFTIDDVKEMINELGEDFYEEILDMLQIEVSDTTDPDLNEVVSRIMKQRNMNRKLRKYMSTSSAKLRQQKAARKKAARQNKASRKRYYRANKAKIAAYQKSRREAIKKGKHKVKLRRKSGWLLENY